MAMKNDDEAAAAAAVEMMTNDNQFLSSSDDQVSKSSKYFSNVDTLYILGKEYKKPISMRFYIITFIYHSNWHI